jgi:hypothetical protein
MMSLSSSSVFPLLLMPAPKHGHAAHGRRRDAPREPRCISAVHVPPHRASSIRSRHHSPGGILTLAALGEILPCPRHPLTGGEGEGGGEEEGNPEARHVYTDAAVKTRRPPWDSSTPRSSELRCASTLHPLRRAADSSLAADPAPLPFTDACTSAHGHSGEERSLLPSVKPDH